MKSVVSDLQKLANKERAAHSSRYFKNGKGEYGEGDIFLGIQVPIERAIARKYTSLSISEVSELLQSPIHNFRQTALFIMTYQWKKADSAGRKNLYNQYLQNINRINNWDLVDCSAPIIIGEYLQDKRKERKILYRFAKSKNIWERRIAIISTFAFLRNKDLDDTMKLAEILINDKQDLMQKAVGWALREVGKRDEKVLVDFLAVHYKTMPRTTLRYAIEKFSFSRRHSYLTGTI